MSKSKKIASLILLVVIIVLNLGVGAVGGILGVVAVSDNSQLRQLFGFDANATIPTTRTDKVILEESSAVIDAVKKVSPSVVSIVTSTQVIDFFGRVIGEQAGGGTGFIITNDGLILTNKHVVQENTDYKVVLQDGTKYDAEVKSLDPFFDLAVVKINAKNLPVVELGGSKELSIGQWVIAVGNALGEFQNTVTVGVVSAKEREIEAVSGNFGQTEKISGLLQTDAAINPGNSGGPLVNLSGQVIGINTAIASAGSGGSIGIGFAIPIDSAKSAIESVRKTGKIVRPMLGVRYLPINKRVAEANNLSVDYGALITRGNSMTDLAVIPGSPADKAGIVENDIVLQIEGEKITEDNPLPKVISQYQVGEKVSLKIFHKGEEKTVEVTLEEIK